MAATIIIKAESKDKIAVFRTEELLIKKMGKAEIYAKIKELEDEITLMNNAIIEMDNWT